MLHSLSVRFYLNEYKAKGGKMPIYLRITVNRLKSELATIYTAEPKEWNETKQRTKKNTAVNEYLSFIESQVYEIAKRLEKEKKPLTAHSIKNYLTQKDRLDAYLLEFFEQYIARLTKTAEEGSELPNDYRRTKDHLEKFFEQKKWSDILIENVNYKFISDFDQYLLSQRVKNDKNNMQRNTVNKHHSRLRTILIRAMKEGYIYKNPYMDFKLKRVPSNRTYLSDVELQKLIAHNLGDNDSLKRVRDIFIFSVYTGLRFEDAQQLTMDRIEKDKENNYTLRIAQEKTNEPLSVPLLRPAIDIITKYENSPERKIFKKVLPKITNQKVNAYLKVIADLTGIKKNLTHHAARHTCATTILLSNEVPIEVVSKWLGHTNIKTTQIYAKITNSYMQKVAKKVEGRILA